ncbi:hypothetical protein IGX29_10765 [Streptomyces sp. H28]|uniref:hypothetical protein n=1 Tax=Streptomyces sp. H28 TaxID=2775865 RepID=UPI00178023DA|nr:hypothetical protein [Streptomyces sp. H28]MBD9732284.1 hypothetical protein [Streptomyces sp. H28]
MVTLRHTVLLAPVPRAWATGALAVTLDLTEATRAEPGGRVVLPDGRPVPDVRLAEGRHLRRGAVYETDGGDGPVEAAGQGTAPQERIRVSVAEWDRRRALRLDIASTGAEGEITAQCALRGPDRPRDVEITGRARLEGVWAPLSRFEGRARLQPDDWWAATDTGRVPRTAPLRVRLRCGIARADLRVTPAPAPADGPWQVTVTVRIRGRHLFRPVAALVLLLTRPHLRRALADGLTDTAARWNEEVPRLTGLTADDLRRELVAGLRDGDGDGDGAP